MFYDSESTITKLKEIWKIVKILNQEITSMQMGKKSKQKGEKNDSEWIFYMMLRFYKWHLRKKIDSKASLLRWNVQRLTLCPAV